MKQIILIALSLNSYLLYAHNATITGTVVLPAINGDTAPYTHLQGVCTDGEFFYYAYNSKLYIADATGKVIKTKLVTHHHGDLCYHDNHIFVAVELGAFNDGAAAKNSRVYKYDTALNLVHEYPVNTAYGCGGIATDRQRFIIVGGLPSTGVTNNIVYEYDLNFNFVASHTLPGPTNQGIQTATYANNQWFFGCYGAKTIVADANLQNGVIYNFDCPWGLEKLDNQRFLVSKELHEGGLNYASSVVGNAIAQYQSGVGFSFIEAFPTSLVPGVSNPVTSINLADVFTYSATGTQTLFLENIKRISFTATEMKTLSAGNVTTTIPFSDFHYFSFKPNNSVWTNVEVNPSTNDISVFQQANLLTAKSQNNISNFQLFSMRGEMFCNLAPEKPEISVPFSYPRGVYILKMGVDGKVFTRKISK